MVTLAVQVRPLRDHELGTLEGRINLDWGNPAKHRRRFEKQQRDEAVYLVAWHGDLPVGHGLVKWGGSTDDDVRSQIDGCPDVEDLFVHPDYRSKGVGRQILSRAEQLAEERGYSRLGLGVSVDNPRARSLYQRCGYEDSGVGQYTARWLYTDKDGQKQWWEETCTYLVKRLSVYLSDNRRKNMNTR